MEENREDESVGASSIGGGYSPENETERAGNKRQKLQGKEDRISALPDSLLQHILSFLPSTKQAIQTGILSKRWQNQWSHVPVLIFDYSGKRDNHFSQSVDNALMLHSCSKIKKFLVQYDCYLRCGPQMTSKIRFATRKNVEELILHLDFKHKDGVDDPYTLPKFLFDNASLVKLELFKCYIGDDRRPNWSSLKELKLECSYVYDSAIEKIVSGSPLLESLQLTRCIGFNNVVIASKSLKRLIFVDVETHAATDKLEILCPNLEELSFKISKDWVFAYSELPNQTIENVLSGSQFLHTLEFPDCGCSDSDRLVIASKSLKKLVLGQFYGTGDFEISCPALEEVNLCRFEPDFSTIGDFKTNKSPLKRLLAMKILGQLQHVKLLEIGSWFIKHLVNLEDCRKEKYRNSNETLFNCSVSNLKTVKIIGLSGRDGKHKLEFKFVELLLKNARMLDKLVIILADCGAGFQFEVSKKLLSFQRCFPHTTIDFLCSN